MLQILWNYQLYVRFSKCKLSLPSDGVRTYYLNDCIRWILKKTRGKKSPNFCGWKKNESRGRREGQGLFTSILLLVLLLDSGIFLVLCDVLRGKFG